MQFSTRSFLAMSVSLLCISMTFAQANLQIIVGSATVSAPSTGNTLEVSITNVGNTASAPVAGFSFGLSVPGASGITFTNATISTVINSYLFAGQTSTPPFSNTGFPNQSFIASDFYAATGGISINPGQTFGLGLITFDVASGASNPTTVTLADFPATGVSDDQANDLAFAGFSGTITIAAVPEPATWAMIGAGAISISGWYYRRRQLQLKAQTAKLSRRK